MPVAVLLCLVGLAVVLVVLARDEPVDVPGPQAPDWDLLPTPADVARVEFPLSLPGYDPATVEVYLDALAGAYEDLLAVATPEVLARARRRAALRRGLAGGDAEAEAGGGQLPARSTIAPAAGDDAEALRLEAALAALDPTSQETG
ncbi:MAG TPA: DivIVA domain-containing protein [Egibacteraceae bacterium]|nr:DivIVA domain-containing protein [Egibacteraceae bacterium]